jgi:hypothetical protein
MYCFVSVRLISRHDGQNDVRVKCEAYRLRIPFSHMQVSLYRCRSSLRTRSVCEFVCMVVVWVSAWIQILQLLSEELRHKKKVRLISTSSYPILCLSVILKSLAWSYKMYVLHFNISDLFSWQWRVFIVILSCRAGSSVVAYISKLYSKVLNILCGH